MLLRIRREIFRAGDFETHEINEGTIFKEDLCTRFHLDPDNTEFYDENGERIKEDIFCGYTMITAVQMPSEGISVGTIVISAAISLAIGGATYLYFDWRAKHSNNAKITYSNSLRGAQNPMRAGGPIGILFGDYRYPLDMAGLVYSDVDNNKQFIHQLFCAGYRANGEPLSPLYNDNCGVVLRKDSSVVDGVKVYGGPGNLLDYKVWIGDTPFGSVSKYIAISASEEHSFIQNFPYYNKRCIEDSLSVKLQLSSLSTIPTSGPFVPDPADVLQYTAPSGCKHISVCINAPYGYYRLDDRSNQTAAWMTYSVECRKVAAQGTVSAWKQFGSMMQAVNVNEYRVTHDIDLTTAFPDFNITDRYEVRIYVKPYKIRDDMPTIVNVNTFVGPVKTDDPKYNTALLVEYIQYDTVNIAKYIEGAWDADAPVYNAEQYELVDLRAQATDKLTGYIDQFYAEAFLQCRAYTGNGQETSNYHNSWTVPSDSIALETRIKMMSNPASVLLYVLTNKNVNPRAVSWDEVEDKIDWIAFREWYNFCYDKDWRCNAWITEQMTIGQLCELICRTGRATFRTVNGKYSVMLACANAHVAQMFTPRNAWDMQMTKSFEKPIDAVRVNFVDESTWTEAERTAYVDENGVIQFDDDITDMEDQMQVESFNIWGVTNPKQIADLEAYQLLQRRLQVRSYTWKCSLEGLLCAIGDVVYIANDNFLYSLGYGRIKKLKKEGSYITGVYVDESLGMESGHDYGLTVRQNDGTFATYRISSISAVHDPDVADNKGEYLILCTLSTPIAVSTAKVEDGNLFMYGDETVAGKKLLVINITYDGDKSATLEAVDYIPEIFETLDSGSWVVPDFVSGISKYGSGANFAKGAVPASVNNPPTSVYPTDLDIDGKIGGQKYEIEYGLSTSPLYPPGDSGDSAWGYSDGEFGAHDAETGELFDYGFYDTAGWGRDYTKKWYKGLYVWQRLKVTLANGDVSYMDTVYCKDITESLINGCTLEIMLTDADGNGNAQTWEKNRAATNGTVPVKFRVLSKSYHDSDHFIRSLSAGGGVTIKAYKGTALQATLTVPTPSISVTEGRAVATYSFSFPKYADYDSLVFDVSVKDTYIQDVSTTPQTTYDVMQKASVEMTADDATVYDPFGDLIPATKNDVNTLADADALAVAYFTERYEGVVEGATYALNCDNIPDVGWMSLRTYVGNNTWKFLSANDLGFSPARVSEICAKAQQCVLSKIPEGSVTLSDFGYFNTIIVGTITADYIGAKQITLQKGGVIQSDGIDATHVQEDGYLDADGFRLEDTGTLRCKSGYFGDISIAGQSVLEGDTLLKGQVENDALTTFPQQATAKTISANFSPAIKTSTVGTRTFYSYGIAKTVIKANAAFGTTAFSGYFTGTVTLDGVTYTGGVFTPIRVFYQILDDGTPEFTISGSTFSVKYGKPLARYAFPDAADFSLCSDVRMVSANCTGNLTAVSLTAIVSNGGFYGHDMLPKSPGVDVIGTSDKMYKEVWAGAFRGNYINATGNKSTLKALDVNETLNVIGKVWGSDVVPPGVVVLMDKSMLDNNYEGLLMSSTLNHFMPCDGSALPISYYQNLFANIGLYSTPEYSSTTSYAVGDCVKYAGEPRWGFKCIRACQGEHPADLEGSWEPGYFKLPSIKQVTTLFADNYITNVAFLISVGDE